MDAKPDAPLTNRPDVRLQMSQCAWNAFAATLADRHAVLLMTMTMMMQFELQARRVRENRQLLLRASVLAQLATGLHRRLLSASRLVPLLAVWRAWERAGTHGNSTADF